MPLTLRRGTVTAVAERHSGLVRLEVDGIPCVAYPGLTGDVREGDEVLVNVQARELGLGSGGFDVLHANLTRGLELDPEEGAHVMKLPYTSLQHAARHGEEERPPAEALDGLPVVCCSLHSQLSPAAAALSGRRVAYVQLPGGALAVPLSDTVRELRRRRLLELSIGAGACFGGDLEAVGVHSALGLAASHEVEAVVCGIGPGLVGTGSRLGHGGMAAAEAASAARALGGEPILAVRVSGADPRERHRGTSHHGRAVFATAPRVRVPWPDGCPFEPPEGAEVVDVRGWRDACAGLSLDHMGRGPEEDPWFFAAAFAAGRLAAAVAAR